MFDYLFLSASISLISYFQITNFYFCLSGRTFQQLDGSCSLQPGNEAKAAGKSLPKKTIRSERKQSGNIQVQVTLAPDYPLYNILCCSKGTVPTQIASSKPFFTNKIIVFALCRNRQYSNSTWYCHLKRDVILGWPIKDFLKFLDSGITVIGFRLLWTICCRREEEKQFSSHQTLRTNSGNF